MMNRRSRGGRWAVFFGVVTVLAASEATAMLIIAEPWIRVSADKRTAEGYMQLRSTEEASVVGLSSDVSSNIAMRKRGATNATITQITLPPGETVLLAPGAQRFVLRKLDHRLNLGDRVALVLTVVDADGTRHEIPVNAEVRMHSPTDDHQHGHRH